MDRIVILQTLEDSYPVRAGQTLADYEASFNCDTSEEKSHERPLSLVRG